MKRKLKEGEYDILDLIIDSFESMEELIEKQKDVILEQEQKINELSNRRGLK